MEITSGDPTDDRTAVREALLFALDHGAGGDSHGYWHSGLNGYDTWIAALENSVMCHTDDVIGFGQGYNAQVWAECRAQVPPFLEEARDRIAKEMTPEQIAEAQRLAREWLAQHQK